MFVFLFSLATITAQAQCANYGSIDWDIEDSCRYWPSNSKTPRGGLVLRQLLIPLRLQPEQTRVLPILGEQTLVIALFHYFTVVDDDNSVCCAYR